MRRWWGLLAVVLLAGCGGLPEGYDDILGLEGAESSVVLCAEPRNEPLVFEIVVFENSGPHDVEFVRVDGIDSEGIEVEAYIIHGSAGQTASFGSQALSRVEANSDAEAEAWVNRQSPPGVVPPDSLGNIVVVVPSPVEGSDVRYVDDFEIEVNVDGRTAVYEWQAFRIIGDDEDCESVPPP